MLTALFSLLSGLVTGILPDILKEVRDSRASVREREFIQLQHRLEMERLRANAEMKIRESEAQLAGAEMQAIRESLNAIIETAAKPTGIPWIDGFNAVLRPTVVSIVIVLFAWIAITYTAGVMDQYATGKIDVAQLDKAIWGTMVGEAIVGVLSFLFGYRGAKKVAS